MREEDRCRLLKALELVNVERAAAAADTRSSGDHAERAAAAEGGHVGIFPQFTRPWPKPRIKLADLGPMWVSQTWQCSGAPEFFSGGRVTGYGNSPEAAYRAFEHLAEKAQGDARGRRWIP